MRFASAVSLNPETAAAVDELIAQIVSQLGSMEPDLALVFVSPHHRSAWSELGAEIRRRLGGVPLVGCSAGGVIGHGREVEEAPGLSLTVAAMPGVDVRLFHLPEGMILDEGAEPAAFRSLFDVDTDPKAVLLFPDPITFDAQRFLRGLDVAWPGVPKVGGLASGGGSPGDNALFIDDAVNQTGAVGVLLSGNVAVQTAVAQGCRPIGPPMIITRCESNRILELDGEEPSDAVRAVFAGLDNERDRYLFQRALFAGIEMTDQAEYKAGDFLIRNIMGVDRKNGGLVIGAVPQLYQVMQLHLRDPESSALDLEAVLERADTESPGAPAGAMLFSCMGRGHRFFGRPDHDTDVFRSKFGYVPLGGFFCSGEIGPVQGKTWLHGWTSSFAFFRPAYDA